MIVRDYGWMMWLLEHGTPATEIRAGDLILLARDRFPPESGRHADIVAISPQDTEAVCFMRSQQAKLS